ncbi:hypothetical protein, partial [Serratia liquefaciens]
VEVAANGQSDRIQSNGSATIGGGEVAVLQEKNVNLLSQGNAGSLIGRQFNILTAQQGISGQFTSTSTFSPFLGAGLTYQPNQVTLNVGRNDTSFASVA